MIKNSYSGKFIVFEGLDGSGLSTQAELLRNYLTEQGKEVILTKEPTRDSEAGKKIREALDKKIKIESLELQKLFAEDRKGHLEKIIIPALKEGKIVISDRYFYSSFAFGSVSGTDLEELIELNKDFLMPDLTIILKISPNVCIEYISNRNKNNHRTLFEEEEKLGKVWQVYEKLPSRFENIYIVDGERVIKEIFEDIKKLTNLCIKP